MGMHDDYDEYMAEFAQMSCEEQIAFQDELNADLAECEVMPSEILDCVDGEIDWGSAYYGECHISDIV